jgi:hypothetical protein
MDIACEGEPSKLKASEDDSPHQDRGQVLPSAEYGHAHDEEGAEYGDDGGRPQTGTTWLLPLLSGQMLGRRVCLPPPRHPPLGRSWAQEVLAAPTQRALDWDGTVVAATAAERLAHIDLDLDHALLADTYSLRRGERKARSDEAQSPTTGEVRPASLPSRGPPGPGVGSQRCGVTSDRLVARARRRRLRPTRRWSAHHAPARHSTRTTGATVPSTRPRIPPPWSGRRRTRGAQRTSACRFMPGWIRLRCGAGRQLVGHHLQALRT